MEATTISNLNKNTYNALATQYEHRANEKLQYNGFSLVIEEFLKHVKGRKRVLDVGCGVGIDSQIIAGMGFNPTGIDISEEVVRLAKKRNPTIKIYNQDFLTFKSPHKFDAIFAQAFIHLFPKDEIPKILSKMKSLLTRKGVLCLTTTKSFESKEGWFPKIDYPGNYNRYRKFWTKEELKKTIAENGFEIVDYYEVVDPYLKTWMNLTLRPVAKSQAKKMNRDLSGILDFVKFTNAFHEVERQILKTKDATWENDTEHSWQLAMVGWYIIEKKKLKLDKNKVILLSLVHDLVEIYAGDTYIFSDVQNIKSKYEREKEAAKKIKRQFSDFKALNELIEEYELSDSSERNFVYALDKLVPLFTIYLDNGRTLKKGKITLDMLIKNKTAKIAASKEIKYYYDLLLEVLKQEEENLFYHE